MPGQEAVDPLEAVRELLQDALEATRDEVLAIHQGALSVRMDYTLHFRRGYGWEVHVHQSTPKPIIVRRRRAP